MTDFPLTPVQQGMLFHHLSEEHRAAGVEVLQVHGPVEASIDDEAFEAAWRAAARRHGALRTTFVWDAESKPRQHVSEEATVDFAVLAVDGDLLEAVEQHLDEDRRRGFDLRDAPPWRVRLLRSSNACHLVWTHHHILLDGRSERVVLKDVFACLDGAPAPAQAAPDFSEHVAWHEARDLAASDDFWGERLAGNAASPLPPEDGPDADDRAGPGEIELALTRQESDDLRRLAEAADATLETVTLAAWSVVLSRYGRTEDVICGCVRAGRYTFDGAKDAVGTLIHAVPVRTELQADETARDLASRLRRETLASRPHEHVPLIRLRQLADVAAGEALYRSIVIYDDYLLENDLRRLGPQWSERNLRLIDHTALPLALYVYGEDEIVVRLAFDRTRFTRATAGRMTGAFVQVLRQFAANDDTVIGDMGLTDDVPSPLESTPAEEPFVPRRIDALFRTCAAERGDATAVLCGDDERTWNRVAQDVEELAGRLATAGVKPGDRVGISMGRSCDLVTALLGVLASGAAYVPLDPDYPAERLRLMIEDSGLRVAVVDDRADRGMFAGVRCLDIKGDGPPASPDEARDAAGVEADDAKGVEAHDAAGLAYVLYTSGSTGRPKGVRVSHANVVSFFEAMDERLGDVAGGTWLAVTSISFDISVLELLYTLTRGCTVVVEGAVTSAAASSVRSPELGLFYFAGREGDEGDAYRLLLEGARFGDEHGFSSVWTPERHFHAFGGLYPNPAVTGAAVAAVTSRIGIRAGSVVMPLQDPLRVAEEWAVVDRLSGGRVGVSFASGWHAGDFVLRPDDYDDRFEKLYSGIEEVRALWRGESLRRIDGAGTETEVRVFPRPVQAELPVWVTSAGNAETFRTAGRIGASLLTHLLGQDTKQLAERLEIYRSAWREAGHPGRGHVTLMIHAFVGASDAEAREKAKQPFIDYLRTSSGLVRALARSLGQEDDLDEAAMDRFLESRYDRYASANALIGDVDRCRSMLADLGAMGVDEAACLIDFGVDDDAVLESLPALASLRPVSTTVGARPTISQLIRRHGVTHLQCTPSAARLIVAEDGGLDALASLRLMMVGGEALDADLANRLTQVLPGRVENMYGPTETTIWSTTAHVAPMTSGVAPIGRPLLRTDVRVLDHHGHRLPVGAPGEIVIGGPGVTDGYHRREELTAERFPTARDGARVYRTGDLGRYREDGTLEFLGRVDNQVKIRGHRIELEEVEARLAEHDAVRAAGARALVDASGSAALVGYLATDRMLDVAEMREFLRGRLPDAMIPTTIVCLEALPLTPNGKLDRNALPEPTTTHERPMRAPGTATEEILVTLWRRVLGREEVSADDDFFQLGGHSLLAVQLANEIQRELGVTLPMSRLFDSPRLSDLATTLDDDLIAAASDDELARALALIDAGR